MPSCREQTWGQPSLELRLVGTWDQVQFSISDGLEVTGRACQGGSMGSTEDHQGGNKVFNKVPGGRKGLG